MTVVATAAPAFWRTEKTVPLTGHSLHRQKPSPVSDGFVPPAMATQIDFRPEALAAAMARTLTLRAAPDAMLVQWARAQFAEVAFLVADGGRFELSPHITALADAERSGFAGRVGAGVTDLLMNALGYVWRDNGACLTGKSNPHADFIYAGGAVSGHGVVLAEAHGSFAQSVAKGMIGGEARRKYRRQVKPHIASLCPHGKVIHGYSIAFGSHPTKGDTHLHVAETKITKSKSKPRAPDASQAGLAAAEPVATNLALAAHRSNFLLMGASQIVAWIDWLRGTRDRPDDEAITSFLAFELSGRRFLVAAEHFFPFIRPWFPLDELDPLHATWSRDEFERWRRLLRTGLHNVFAMEEWAAKTFLATLSRMIGSGRDQIPRALDLPVIRPERDFPMPDRTFRDDDARYPITQFSDGLALLGRLPRRERPDRRSWSPLNGFQ